MAHEFQKTRIHDFFGWKYVPRAGLAIRNGEVPWFGSSSGLGLSGCSGRIRM